MHCVSATKIEGIRNGHSQLQWASRWWRWTSGHCGSPWTADLQKTNKNQLQDSSKSINFWRSEKIPPTPKSQFGIQEKIEGESTPGFLADISVETGTLSHGFDSEKMGISRKLVKEEWRVFVCLWNPNTVFCQLNKYLKTLIFTFFSETYFLEILKVNLHRLISKTLPFLCGFFYINYYEIFYSFIH